MAESRVRDVRLPEDGAVLVRLIEDHASYERGSADVVGLLTRLTALVEESRLRLWVVQVGDALAGYASATVDVATWSGRPFMYLDCLFIAVEYRNGGFGAQLMKAVIASAAELQLDNVQWQTPTWNLDAVRFYDRFGPVRREKARFTLEVTGVQQT